MSVVLLTGAGFSRNWGGWLAAEAFEYLISIDHIHPRVRHLLWQFKDQGGFEAVYQILKDGATTPRDKDVFQDFHMMVAGMFHTMGQGLARAEFGTTTLSFLTSFDAIFTLNQDTLFEWKYPQGEEHRQRSRGKFIGYEIPGVRSAGPEYLEPPGFYVAQDGPYSLTPGYQPYFKLHGSSNWVQSKGSDLMLIIGGNKAVEIEKQPLLKWYHQEFQSRISGNQLVIIGYSFQDEHINRYLSFAATQGTRFFVIDPLGVNAVQRAPSAPVQLIDNLRDSIDGASRRDLITTFSTDTVEYSKINHFMTRSLRR